MPRSEPGAATSLPKTSTSPTVGGCCGSRPAINLKMVLLPQPLGPKMQTNSPLPGKSATTKFTSRIAVNWFAWPSLYVLVTFLNSTTCGTFRPGGLRTPDSTRPMPTSAAGGNDAAAVSDDSCIWVFLTGVPFSPRLGRGIWANGSPVAYQSTISV